MRVQNQILALRVMAAGLFLIAGALFIVFPAAADDRATCTNSSGDVAIAACTRAIVSGQYPNRNVAPLYTSRGLAYWAKGQHDRAIRDFERAIRLDPQFARGDRTDPVAVGADQFICCRAILVDCRFRAVWAIRNIRGNTKHCVEACLRSLKC